MLSIEMGGGSKNFLSIGGGVCSRERNSNNRRGADKNFEERQQFLANALSKPVEAGEIGLDIFGEWVLDLFDKRWVKLVNPMSWIQFYCFDYLSK